MSGELSSVLQRFRVAAANFIEVVDAVSNLDSEIFLARVNLRLAELYSMLSTCLQPSLRQQK
jgi:hypothetical protein